MGSINGKSHCNTVLAFQNSVALVKHVYKSYNIRIWKTHIISYPGLRDIIKDLDRIIYHNITCSEAIQLEHFVDQFNLLKWCWWQRDGKHIYCTDIRHWFSSPTKMVHQHIGHRWYLDTSIYHSYNERWLYGCSCSK